MDSHSRKIARVVSNAWLDPKYMKRLKSDPKSVLNEAGIFTAETVQVHEETSKVSHFIIPRRPAHIKDEDLKKSDVHPDLCCTL
ncbi:MAG: hypothetical protein AB1762_03135 [Gemmatimonadota bacterium]